MSTIGKKLLCLDHVSVEVRPGQLEPAVKLFEFLGYTEGRRKKWRTDDGEGEGEAVFMNPPTGGFIEVQLSTHSLVNPAAVTECHLAYETVYPTVALAWEIANWAEGNGITAQVEEVGEGRCFIHFRKLAAFSIELVPSQRH